MLFMMRQKDLLKRAQCKKQDINRYSWFTIKNFTNMYEGVYQGIANADIAVKREEAIMYDKKGQATTKVSEIFGHPIKEITNPEYLLFVDKRGCNTNMQEAGFAGGQLFVLPVDIGSQTGCNGASTNIHFMVLCFTSGTGKPVLCDIILKLEGAGYTS
jgi:hypothetical protein